LVDRKKLTIILGALRSLRSENWYKKIEDSGWLHIVPETSSFEDPNVDIWVPSLSSPASNFGGCWFMKKPFHFLALWLDKKWPFYSHPWNYGIYWLFPLQHITQSYLVTNFWVISSSHSCGRSLYACRATNSCSILFYGYLMLT
jgi:hypothetical protein